MSLFSCVSASSAWLCVFFYVHINYRSVLKLLTNEDGIFSSRAWDSRSFVITNIDFGQTDSLDFWMKWIFHSFWLRHLYVINRQLSDMIYLWLLHNSLPIVSAIYVTVTKTRSNVIGSWHSQHKLFCSIDSKDIDRWCRSKHKLRYWYSEWDKYSVEVCLTTLRILLAYIPEILSDEKLAKR